MCVTCAAVFLWKGATSPLTLDAEELCHETGITVVPDFVANAGGVISSYVEWKGGGKDEVFPLVEERVAGNTTRVLQAALDRGITPRQAALSPGQGTGSGHPAPC